jgi:hypothetical protein
MEMCSVLFVSGNVRIYEKESRREIENDTE